MGYDLHIVHTADWLDAADAPVDPEAWAREAATLAPYGEIGTIGDDGQVTMHPVVCLQPPEGPTLHLDRGRVRIEGADESHVPALVQIARRLGARLVGDDGEEYDEGGEI